MFGLIEADELFEKQKSDTVQIVDIRVKDEYNEGHIEGAVHIPDFFTYLSESTIQGQADMIDFFEHRLSEKGMVRNKPIVIYENEMDKLYGGSCRGAFILTFLGHEEVYVLHGGYSFWKNNNYKVSKDVPQMVKSSYNAAVNKDYFVDYKEMKAALADDTVFILDNRDKDEWIGYSSSPYGLDFSPRKGRLPRSKWLEWYKLMDTSNGIPMFKSNDQIQAIAAENNIAVDTKIIIYCFKGSRASNTLLALHKAGFTNVKVYFASWYEWSKNPELPIDEEKL